MNEASPLPKVPSEIHELKVRDYPQVIKYMGSKAKIIKFVTEGLQEAYRGGAICDLFAGACTLSGALGHTAPIISNDIQSYSKVISQVYLHRLSIAAQKLSPLEITERASTIVAKTRKSLPQDLTYPVSPDLPDFNEIDQQNRDLINKIFPGKYHLFVKFYSGTWWSAEQCMWIDALREATDQILYEGRINQGDHGFILTCIMHAMAYCGQGTGHYAQYRDAKTTSSLADINLYRQKSIAEHFARKFVALKAWNTANVSTQANHQMLSMDYVDCLKQLSGGTVYADPPYAFVHYSRFYHAIETFVLYDYPDLQIKGGAIVKGRYRDNRHQSPFSIRSQVPEAFTALFKGVEGSGSNLVLSYSNSGLFKLSEMFELAQDCIGKYYEISALTTDHTHMTMGRREDRDREVEEALLVAVRK